MYRLVYFSAPGGASSAIAPTPGLPVQPVPLVGPPPARPESLSGVSGLVVVEEEEGIERGEVESEQVADLGWCLGCLGTTLFKFTIQSTTGLPSANKDERYCLHRRSSKGIMVEQSKISGCGYGYMLNAAW